MTSCSDSGWLTVARALARRERKYARRLGRIVSAAMARPCASATAVSETATTSPACAMPRSALATIPGTSSPGRSKRVRTGMATKRAPKGARRSPGADLPMTTGRSSIDRAQPFSNLLELVLARTFEQDEVAGPRAFAQQRDRFAVGAERQEPLRREARRAGPALEIVCELTAQQ